MASDQEMLARIAQLSTAIEQRKALLNHSQQPQHYNPSIPRGGRSRGRGLGYRGRGGMHLSLVNDNRWSNPNSPLRSNTPPTNLFLANSPSSIPQHASSLALSSATGSTSHNTSSPSGSLLTTSASSPALNKIPTSAIPVVAKNSSTDIKNEYVISGRKLFRKDLMNRSPIVKPSKLYQHNRPTESVIRSSSPAAAAAAAQKPLRRGLNGGPNKVFIRQPEGYVRQGRSGRSLVLNAHKSALRRRKPRYCGFYTRFGRCPNAARCPFVHDPKRKAICPRFLANRCKKPAHLCKLSHYPNPHIMPHCVYLQKGSCTNEGCAFIHVKVNSKAPVCRAFAMEGYCPKGLHCNEKHVHVCPEFAETGRCSNANCRLPHVAKLDRNDSASNVAGVVRLGTWVSADYFYAQKKAQRLLGPILFWKKKRKAEQREKEEAEGFVRLLDDSDDDDGWSQYERIDSGDEDLRFNDDEQDTEIDDLEDGELDIDMEENEEIVTNEDAETSASAKNIDSSEVEVRHNNFVQSRGGDSLEEGELLEYEGDKIMVGSIEPMNDIYGQNPAVVPAGNANVNQQASDDEFFDALNEFDG
ncbi:hypothetical protein BDF20DRAFT_903717 [Mycotypha africana]|uniref:uncharacterized protein n=1 Tax=Mycotypha africana TaxID=64632 RepID=UPI002300B9E1|nr:uncharacterized protein BDF20DRAFT_903717 [Mycotypha africana]KAI8966905.1 hypothetical protein BDF20DRAFT_903717 [Mycotypha africana]